MSKNVYILGIESSCDETAAAVVKNGREVLSNIIASQVVIHRKFGGVVPEIASRKHIENILPVIDEALRREYGRNRCCSSNLRPWSCRGASGRVISGKGAGLG